MDWLRSLWDESGFHRLRRTLETTFGVYVPRKKEFAKCEEALTLPEFFEQYNFSFTNSFDNTKLAVYTRFDAQEVHDTHAIYESLLSANYQGANLVHQLLQGSGVDHRVVKIVCSALQSNEVITFPVLLCIISIFDRGSAAEKLAFIFSLFDYDCSGTLSQAEVLEVITSISADSLTEAEVDALVDELFNSLDRNGDGEISFEEIIEGYPIVETLLSLSCEPREEEEEEEEDEEQEEDSGVYRDASMVFTSAMHSPRSPKLDVDPDLPAEDTACSPYSCPSPTQSQNRLPSPRLSGYSMSIANSMNSPSGRMPRVIIPDTAASDTDDSAVMSRGSTVGLPPLIAQSDSSNGSSGSDDLPPMFASEPPPRPPPRLVSSVSAQNTVGKGDSRSRNTSQVMSPSSGRQVSFDEGPELQIVAEVVMEEDGTDSEGSPNLSPKSSIGGLGSTVGSSRFGKLLRAVSSSRILTTRSPSHLHLSQIPTVEKESSSLAKLKRHQTLLDEFERKNSFDCSVIERGTTLGGIGGGAMVTSGIIIANKPASVFPPGEEEGSPRNGKVEENSEL